MRAMTVTGHCLVNAVVLAVACGWVAPTAMAQPAPGDVFREYCWTNKDGDAGGSLRVGGRFDYGGGPIVLPYKLDLEHAIAAEAVVEKLLCHDGTRGLAISVNGHPWISIPEAELPLPPWDYQHHICPVVRVPLAYLKSGGGNQFRMKVDKEHPWNWPQNLVYGVHFRVYYVPANKPHVGGRIVSPAANAKLGTELVLRATIDRPVENVRSVDFIGHYEDVNLEGDGRYTQWHYRYDHGRLVGILGTAKSPPWKALWDTSWVPDQAEPMRVVARITDTTGLISITPAAGGMVVERPGFSVEICKPYDVPKKWVTRSGTHDEHFRISGDLSKARAAQLVWHSWSPGYMAGVFINGHKVIEAEGPRYAPFVHRVAVEDLQVFKSGENTLRTGQSPKRNGKMVHGMEVNWPGIMVLIQYDR